MHFFHRLFFLNNVSPTSQSAASEFSNGPVSRSFRVVDLWRPDGADGADGDDGSDQMELMEPMGLMEPKDSMENLSVVL